MDGVEYQRRRHCTCLRDSHSYALEMRLVLLGSLLVFRIAKRIENFLGSPPSSEQCFNPNTKRAAT
jgi:hypothetical protein